MPSKPLSTRQRALLRSRIIQRIADLGLSQAAAAKALRFTPSQVSRLAAGEDIFSLDRLVDAAGAVGLAVRMTVTRPYRAK
jgi:predicted XRE-type DNA-binding protein